MIKRLLSLGALCLATMLFVAACATPAPVGATGSTAYSPREQAQAIQDSYVLALAAASAAVDTGKLPADVVQKIGAASETATAAERAAVAEAKKCLRDATTGVVGDAPGLPDGQHCDPNTSSRLINAFSTQLGNLQGTLGAFGIKVQTTPPQ